MLVAAHQLWELHGRVEGREVILHEVWVVLVVCWPGAMDWNGKDWSPSSSSAAISAGLRPL